MKVLLLAERWQRASAAHAKWAERAKVGFDFFEGRQYTQSQMAALKRQGRPYFKFNIIAPLVRLVQGYQGNNKTDITFKPGNDARATRAIADVLGKVEKCEASSSLLEFVDCEVFLDGLVGGRGFYDSRLEFDQNILGELVTKASDPFQTYPDPDGDTYDLYKSGSYIQTAKMVSVDEVEAGFGKQIAQMIRPFTMGQTPLAPISSLVVQDEITPIRTFGEREDLITDWWDQFYALSGDFVDTYRKTIRLIETQYKVREQRNVLFDLETGDWKALPDDWDDEKIAKAVLYCEQLGNPVVPQRTMVERVHWTTMAGDLILYDSASMYDGFTITPYFPYFRRGMTRGMVDDLIDPQIDKNKQRNARIEIQTKTANGGWMYHEQSLDPDQERKLRRFGSMPGVQIKWKGDADKKPTLVESSSRALSQERLEQADDRDIRAISGINETALGELDRVQSGRAIEARQRQAVLSVQTYMDNFKRSKMLLGKNHLSIFQQHYTEQRFFRLIGDNGKDEELTINELLDLEAIKRIKNDITVGKYQVVVDPSPLSATFQAAQFEEMMTLLEKLGPAGAAAVPAVIDLIIGMSSMPQKDEWIKRLQAAMGMQPAAGADPAVAGAPPGAAAPLPAQQALPAPQPAQPQPQMVA
jgi:hypothetical protein